MGRWDVDDPYNNHWEAWLKGLDQAIKEIEEIDKESDYRRLSFIIKHDENRGYDQEVLEALK